MVEILGQAVEAEILGYAVHAPGFGFRLEGPQHHLACVLLVIGAFVGDAQDGQTAQAFDGFGEQVEMFAGMQRQGDAGPCGQIAAPHAAAVDDDIGGDMAAAVRRFPIDACDTGAIVSDAGDLDAFHDARAAHACAFGQCHGDIGGVALAIQRQVDAAQHVADLKVRIHGFDLGR